METVAVAQPQTQEAAQVPSPANGAELKRKHRVFQSRPLFEDKKTLAPEATPVPEAPVETVIDPGLEDDDMRLEMTVRVVRRTKEVTRKNFGVIAHAVTTANQGMLLHTLENFFQEAKHAVAIKVNEHLRPADKAGDGEASKLTKALPEFTGEPLGLHTHPKVDLPKQEVNGTTED